MAFLLIWQVSGSTETKMRSGRVFVFNMREGFFYFLFSPVHLLFVYRSANSSMQREGPLTLTAIFAVLGWWRSARTDLKCLWLHSSGEPSNFPVCLAFCPIYCHPAGPLTPVYTPAQTQHPTPAGPLGRRLRDKNESKSESESVCFVISC